MKVTLVIHKRYKTFCRGAASNYSCNKEDLSRIHSSRFKRIKQNPYQCCLFINKLAARLINSLPGR